MDETIVKRLLMSRYQCELGMSELGKNTDVGAWQAVVHFHDALETLLITIADSLSVPRRRIAFLDYPAEINKQSDTNFRHAKMLEEINDLRVPIKHRAIYPNPEAVRDVGTRLGIVFEDNVREFFDISFRDVSLADMIRDTEVRDASKIAVKQIDAEEYFEALAHLRVAFELLVRRYRQSLPVHAKSSVELPDKLFDETRVRRAVDGLTNRQELEDLFRNADETYQEIRHELDTVMLGIHPPDYAKFMFITPSIYFFEGGRWEVAARTSALTQKREDAEFCLRFVLEAAQRLEGTYKVSDTWSFYRLRLTKDAPYYAYRNSVWTEKGRLSAGTEIDDAKITLVSGLGREYWAWDRKGNDAKYVALDACKILEECPHEVYFEQKRNRRGTKEG